ncbi:MAG: holo-ACP synthase [Motiliproteus sp.]|nr:holo-ACP synthase [Motiliproteus sp.]MCW9050712.1 holo-ACP synthase [Motiliproteus sp.]
MIVGIGTDVVEIVRMKQALDQFGDKFAARILTLSERHEFKNHHSPAVFLAKRFAVKEAATKALGTGIAKGVSWQHIEIGHDELGAPKLYFSGRALELQKNRKITSLHVSLADEREYVVAFVILEK